MAKKIKRFFVFLILSLVFSLFSNLSGRVQHSPGGKTGIRVNGGMSWNSATAGMCCTEGAGWDSFGNRCCCPCGPGTGCYQ